MDDPPEPHRRRRPRRARVTRTCEVCDATFLCAPSQVELGKGRYCSVACYNAGRVASPLRSCEVCAKEFRVKPAEVAKGWGRYCSRSCQGRAQFSGSSNPRWQGGRWLSEYGYVIVQAGDGRRVPEHRLVMERALGRPLRTDEIVHHLNGIKTDNRPENLMLATREAHVGMHRNKHGRWSLRYERCRHCGSASVPHAARGLCDNCYVRLRAHGQLPE